MVAEGHAKRGECEEKRREARATGDRAPGLMTRRSGGDTRSAPIAKLSGTTSAAHDGAPLSRRSRAACPGPISIDPALTPRVAGLGSPFPSGAGARAAAAPSQVCFSFARAPGICVRHCARELAQVRIAAASSGWEAGLSSLSGAPIFARRGRARALSPAIVCAPPPARSRRGCLCCSSRLLAAARERVARRLVRAVRVDGHRHRLLAARATRRPPRRRPRADRLGAPPQPQPPIAYPAPIPSTPQEEQHHEERPAREYPPSFSPLCRAAASEVAADAPGALAQESAAGAQYVGTRPPAGFYRVGEDRLDRRGLDSAENAPQSL